jgi:hypothetical protein
LRGKYFQLRLRGDYSFPSPELKAAAGLREDGAREKRRNDIVSVTALEILSKTICGYFLTSSPAFTAKRFRRAIISPPAEKYHYVITDAHRV